MSLGSEPPVSAPWLVGRRPHISHSGRCQTPALPPLSPFLSQLKDEAFEETEKNFRMQERLIKSFIRDLSLYLQHVRVSLGVMWGSPRAAPLACMVRTCSTMWQCFCPQPCLGVGLWGSGLPQEREPSLGAPFPWVASVAVLTACP